MSQFSKLNPNFKPAFDGPNEARKLIQKLQAQLPIVDAYLFGSAAEGKNTENSDLDILVIVAMESDVQRAYSIVNEPYFSTIAVDWIVKTEIDFLRDREIGGVCRIAFLTGKKICSNDDGQQTFVI